MSNRSNPFFMRITGAYALFTSADSRGGGEKFSYFVPTREALRGMADAIYWKPTFVNVIDEVRVMKPIRTFTSGINTMVDNGTGRDLHYYTYLRDVEYLVKFHFEWDLNREDLAGDRNMGKHTAIMVRSLEKGGRFDLFLGVRECIGHAEYIREEEYESMKGHYDQEEEISFGIMFSHFDYPKNEDDVFQSVFEPIVMRHGRITYRPYEDYTIKHQLTAYAYKSPDLKKGVDEEEREYLEMEGGVQ